MKKTAKKIDRYAAGVRDAAAIAAMFDGASDNQYLVSDVILCKLNIVRRRYPRKNKEAGARAKAFLRGFAMALAEINRKWDQPSTVKEVCREASVTVRSLRDAGVEDYDLGEIFRAIGRSK